MSHTTPELKRSLTKIVATIGPASSSEDVLQRLIESGVAVFRLNFSHGTLAEHEARLKAIRNVSGAMRRPIAVMGDLQGPKIRVGTVPAPGIELERGHTVRLVRGEHAVDPKRQPIELTSTYEALVDDVEIGQRVLINDGAIRMLATAKSSDAVECTVLVGGLVTSGKGINLPESLVTAPAISEQDRECVAWAVEHGLDYLALSFVRSAHEVNELRELINKRAAALGKQDWVLPVVAKIELPGAVERAAEIIEVSDAIMVARGDLGVEMDLARVPVIQKRLNEIAQDYGRPCIVATQMLESMINAPMPTRAEASDVSNAILDGADAVMLSGETAVGQHPVLAVEYMRRIAAETEAYQSELGRTDSAPTHLRASGHRTAALAHGVRVVANDLHASVIVVWSQRGGGARYLSQNNFPVPIVAISTDDRALRQMQLLRGVIPVRMPVPENLAHFTSMVDAILLNGKLAREGDTCVLVAGSPVGRPGVTNSLAIHRVGSPDTGYARSGAIPQTDRVDFDHAGSDSLDR